MIWFAAQVYGHLGDPLRSSKYIHATLKRQLETKEYNDVVHAHTSTHTDHTQTYIRIVVVLK